MTITIPAVMLCAFAWTFARQRGHVLNLLIALEAAMLSVLVFYYFSTTLYSSNSVLFLMLLTFAACEAAFGLALLVNLLRLSGNDLVSSMATTSWFAKNSHCSIACRAA
uniref:NADH-ubiquinone oxidoreductase chain 4L n=1 Tax=Leucophytia bidentata TaxID=999262 RepID=G8HMU3_9EUPU|nr:NADH dehydrogenase subunit 4L [Leucophytia bidentata]AEQ93817.1 NADH dehydrogenase subunit 4L [Leucophytia bidentata]